MASLIKEVIYKDLDFAFTAHPLTGDVQLLENTKAISRAVKNLVFTNKFEVPYEPALGSDVIKSLFENFDPIQTLILKNKIRDVITNYEPRVELIEILISDAEALDRNEINIRIKYRDINAKDPVEIALFIEKVR